MQSYGNQRVEETIDFEVVQYSDLTFKWPEYLYEMCGRKCVMFGSVTYVM